MNCEEDEGEAGGRVMTGTEGKWEGLCHHEADVSTRQLADQWDVVNQQSDPYALTSLWTAEGQQMCLFVKTWDTV